MSRAGVEPSPARGLPPGTPPDRPRRRRRRPAGDIGLNLTSMIDVVFLLLVYFMAATEFRSGEEVYKLDLPERSGAAAADPFELDDEPLRIEVRSRGPVADELSLAGAGITVPGPYPQPMDFRELRTLLEELLVTPDPQDQIDLANQIDILLWENLATIPVFSFPGVVAYSDDVSNVIYNPSQNGLTWNASEWSRA